MTDKTIKIFVDGGCVTDVFNLPDGFDYVVIDSDVQEESTSSYLDDPCNKGMKGENYHE
tara:strand:+ start:502 stop:678 length:177 start_codon:yes stop_codon:yes gene_type:complete